MSILTLEECLKEEALTRRVYNRLKIIEQKIMEQGEDSLPQFLFTQYHEQHKTIISMTKDILRLTGMTTSHGRLREYVEAMGIHILPRSEALSGERNPNYGNRGNKNPLTGTTISESRKRELSEKRKGKRNPFWGKTHSDKNKKLMARATRGKTWEEICGEEVAKKRKENLRARQSGENSFFYGKKGSQSPSFGRNNPYGLNSSHGGFRRDLGHFVRSTWEANVARIFLLKGENYQYEPQRFVLEITEDYSCLFPGIDKTTYLPDFKNGHFYEVKGTFDTKHSIISMAKILMFMEQYDAEIEVISTQEYKELEKQFAESINSDPKFCGWETLSDNVKTNPSKYR